MAGNGPPLKKPRFLDVEEAVASQWKVLFDRELDPTADFAKTALGRIPKTVLLKLTAEDLADALKRSIQNDGEATAVEWFQDVQTAKDGMLKPSSAEAKCIGMVQEKPSAWWMLRQTEFLDFNSQSPCAVYGLHRLVVVASAGSELSQLIGKDGDVRVPHVLQLPVWRHHEFHIWLKTKKLPNLSEEDLEAKESELDQNCGLTVPRLAVMYLQNQFEGSLQKFIHSVAGRNSGGQELSPKDAHTMVVLRGSRELLDEYEETEGGGSDRVAGDVIGWVSSRVETAMCTHKHAVIQHLIRDAKKFYFIQIATGREHTRIQTRHLERGFAKSQTDADPLTALNQAAEAGSIENATGIFERLQERSIRREGQAG
eukprot:s3989_g3.t1